MSETTKAPSRKQPTRRFLDRVQGVERTGERIVENGEALGPEATERGEELLKAVAEIKRLNTLQESLKLQLAETTVKLNAALKEAEEERSRLIKLAEAKLPKNDPRIKAIKTRT
jgi:cell shape-determining protein MreC